MILYYLLSLTLFLNFTLNINGTRGTNPDTNDVIYSIVINMKSKTKLTPDVIESTISSKILEMHPPAITISFINISDKDKDFISELDILLPQRNEKYPGIGLLNESYTLGFHHCFGAMAALVFVQKCDNSLDFTDVNTVSFLTDKDSKGNQSSFGIAFDIPFPEINFRFLLFNSSAIPSAEEHKQSHLELIQQELERSKQYDFLLLQGDFSQTLKLSSTKSQPNSSRKRKFDTPATQDGIQVKDTKETAYQRWLAKIVTFYKFTSDYRPIYRAGPNKDWTAITDSTNPSLFWLGYYKQVHREYDFVKNKNTCYLNVEHLFESAITFPPYFYTYDTVTPLNLLTLNPREQHLIPEVIPRYPIRMFFYLGEFVKQQEDLETILYLSNVSTLQISENRENPEGMPVILKPGNFARLDETIETCVLIFSLKLRQIANKKVENLFPVFVRNFFKKRILVGSFRFEDDFKKEFKDDRMGKGYKSLRLCLHKKDGTKTNFLTQIEVEEKEEEEKEYDLKFELKIEKLEDYIDRNSGRINMEFVLYRQIREEEEVEMKVVSEFSLAGYVNRLETVNNVENEGELAKVKLMRGEKSVGWFKLEYEEADEVIG